MKKVALVTGASQGIGKGIADALCDAGYEVVRVSRHPERDGDDHFGCDISSAADRAALAEFIDKKYGRLGCYVAATLEGAVDVGIVIGVAYRYVYHSDSGIHQLTNEHICFGEVEIVLFIRTESVGLRNHIRRAKTRANEIIRGNDLLHRANAVKIKSGSVLERAAVFTGTVKCGKKLLEKVSVAGLNVNSVEARLDCEKGGVRILLGQSFKVLVRNDIIVGNGALLLVYRMASGKIQLKNKGISRHSET